MKTKNIEKHPDFNCIIIADQPYYLLGGKDGKSEPLHIALPYYVRLIPDASVRRELNRWCEGWYSCGSRSHNDGFYWFEKDTDALQARIVFGEPGLNP